MAKTAKYTGDDGNDYTIQVADFVDDMTNAETGLAASAADPLPPKGLKVRGFFIQSPTGRRKFVPANTSGTRYANGSLSVTGTIDGETGWVTTGRKGERLSYVSIGSIS